MNKTLLTLLIVPILLASTSAALPIRLGYGQATQTKGDGVSFEDLWGLFDVANGTLAGVLETVEGRGGTIPDVVWEHYDTGLATAKEAVNLREAGRSAEAKEKVIEAMQHLRDAILAVAEEFESVQTPEERDALKAAGILEATERINATIYRFNDILEKAEKLGLGLEASRIRERLTLVNETLAEIYERIKDGDISAAEEGIEMSHQELGQAMTGLRPIIEANKVNQAGRFLDTAEERLSSISGMITSVIDTLPITVPDRVKEMIKERVGQGIQTAQDKIAEARSLLQEGRVNEAMPLLDELREDIANVMAEVEQQTPGIGVALENIDRRETVLEVLEDTAEILSGKGVDVTDLLTKIQEARGLVQDAIESLKIGNLEAVNAKLAQVDGIIEEAKDLADQLVAQG